jgi:hypothetical protein
LWNEIIGERDRYHTPLSDYLLRLFKEWSSSFAGLSPDFELLFERFELLGSLAHLERRDKADIAAKLQAGENWASMPVGRVGWRTSGAQRLFSELQTEPTQGAILQAGFAKGSPDFLKLFFDYLTRSRKW